MTIAIIACCVLAENVVVVNHAVFEDIMAFEKYENFVVIFFEPGVRFYDALKLFKRLVNIGDVRSLVAHPASTTHAGLSEEVRMEMGVTEGMLRLAVSEVKPGEVVNLATGAMHSVRDFVQRAMRAAPGLGSGHGPLNHMVPGPPV